MLGRSNIVCVATGTRPQFICYMHAHVHAGHAGCFRTEDVVGDVKVVPSTPDSHTLTRPTPSHMVQLVHWSEGLACREIMDYYPSFLLC